MFFAAFAWLLLPTGVLLAGLLCLPLHSKIRRYVLSAVDIMLFYRLRIFISISLYWFVVATAFLTLVYETREMLAAQAHYSNLKLLGRMDELSLQRKFRLERNWWLSAFTLGTWLMVYKLRSLLCHIDRTEYFAKHPQRHGATIGTQTAVPSVGAPAPLELEERPEEEELAGEVRKRVGKIPSREHMAPSAPAVSPTLGKRIKGA